MPLKIFPISNHKISNKRICVKKKNKIIVRKIERKCYHLTKYLPRTEYESRYPPIMSYFFTFSQDHQLKLTFQDFKQMENQKSLILSKIPKS